MPQPVNPSRAGRPLGARRPRKALRLLATTLLVVAFAASTALAAHLGLTLGSSTNPTLGEHVVVNSQGRTLYTLSPETSRHLLCKTSQCLGFWPPLTVAASTTRLKAGSGVQGHLGILRRSNGVLQVTLRGLPLYRYSKDHANGQANGQGVQSFGGTWHAASASSGEGPHEQSTPSTQPMTSAAPSDSESTPMPPAPATTPSTPSTTPAPSTAPPPYQYPAY